MVTNRNLNTMSSLLLGLIGDNISKSKAPLLHRMAGHQHGVEVQYDLLVPRERGLSFTELFDWARSHNYRGLNITYPYKEIAFQHCRVPDPFAGCRGAVNTVVFEGGHTMGYNTDRSGFVQAMKRVRGDKVAGRVALIGAGGVGRAVAFGLAELDVTELRIADLDTERAKHLVSDLQEAIPTLAVDLGGSAEEAASGADGLINCTPIGMDGYPGTPLPAEAMTDAQWAFDAIYTPMQTEFLMNAQHAGLEIVSGYELFIFQGIHAWHHFDGRVLDEPRLREALKSAQV